jgi:hypothetical protein
MWAEKYEDLLKIRVFIIFWLILGEINVEITSSEKMHYK